MNNNQLSDDNLNKLLENINLCCIKINEKNNLNLTFKKLDCLKNTNFYDNFPNTKFIE